MRYTIKSGALYQEPEHQVLAKIRSALPGPIKTISHPDNHPFLKTDIQYPDTPDKSAVDVRLKKYVMIDNSDHPIAIAQPFYAKGEDPSETGWPVCRLPKVNQAELTIHGAHYVLIMHNTQNFSLQNADGKDIVRLLHKGISGGWNLEDEHGFSPAILGGLFAFCRYLELENEFLIV